MSDRNSIVDSFAEEDEAITVTNAPKYFVTLSLIEENFIFGPYNTIDEAVDAAKDDFGIEGRGAVGDDPMEYMIHRLVRRLELSVVVVDEIERKEMTNGIE